MLLLGHSWIATSVSLVAADTNLLDWAASVRFLVVLYSYEQGREFKQRHQCLHLFTWLVNQLILTGLEYGHVICSILISEERDRHNHHLAAPYGLHPAGN